MRRSPAYPALVLLALIFGATTVSAKPMHSPEKMPMASPESVGMSTEGLRRIDDMMQEKIDAGHIQGGATIVARHGKVVHFSTHGEMDVEKGRVMDPDALYIMASSEKPLVAVATLMLVEEGLISLSDPLSKFIPEFADQQVAHAMNWGKEGRQKKDGKKEGKKGGDKKAWGKKEWGKKDSSKKDSKKEWDKETGNKKGKDMASQHLVPVDAPVTIHHMLTHTSGLTTGGIHRTKGESLATYVHRLAKAPLTFQPGTRWVYSNVAFHIVLPRIIEIVSGTSYHQFMQEQLFNPLEMNNTYFDVPSKKMSKVILRNALKLKGGGGLLSTAEDFLHFEQMLLNGGELFGHRLLREATVKMMGSNQVGDLFANSGKGAKAQKGMGFGYGVSVTLDAVAAGNGRGDGAFGWGGAAGTSSWTDPENALVGVLMLQQPRGGGNYATIVREAIID